MSKDLIVFMPQFRAAYRHVLEHNFQSFVKHNPGIEIVIFPEDNVKDPFCRKMLQQHWTGWRNPDLVFFDFYRQNPGYERYLFIEWDVYCTMNVHKLINPARRFDVVCRDVIPARDFRHWFPFTDELLKVPDEFKPLAVATRPICGMCLSARALEKMSKPHPLLQMDLYSEIRMGILARLNGFEPAAYPVHGASLAPDFPLTLNDIRGEGLWHNVKARYFPFKKPDPDCPLIGYWTGPLIHGGREFQLCNDGSIKLGKAFKGQWVYEESYRELLLSWIDRGMEWYDVSSDMCHRGMQRIFKARYTDSKTQTQ